MAPAAPPPASAPKAGGLRAWIYKRFPVQEFIAEQLTGYYAPKNFNIWYFFGSLALVVLVLQLVTGIFLTMFYKPGEADVYKRQGPKIADQLVDGVCSWHDPGADAQSWTRACGP